MTRCVFQAGFNWKVIDAKWDGFVAAFDQFDPATVARYGEPDIDRLLGDQGIVRNLHKIEATIRNAAFILDVQVAHGSFGAFLALYPPSGYQGLLTDLSKRGGRLSGTTGQRVLRQGGYPSYILTPDVIAALVREGIIDQASSSGKGMARIQAAFDRWAGESGRSLTELSQILAHSI